MVTDYQLLRAAQSLAYRRKLLDGMEELEDIVRKYLVDHDFSIIRIGGYDLLAENGQIRLAEAPMVLADQLRLPLEIVGD
ncbi:MAG: hypothetical protein FVQ79_01685 [Planctomycetes bacterium]|nr:hypothetical protein [Planctomycetota bacterium]